MVKATSLIEGILQARFLLVINIKQMRIIKRTYYRGKCMEDFMLEIVNDFGYWGIFLLIFIENIFPPIPSEAVLLFGGALTINTQMSAPGVIASATLGAVVGAIVLYLIGRIFQAQKLKEIFAGRFGRIFHLKPEYVDKSVGWFEKYQSRAVLICRCIPLMRSLISIPAGISAMNISKFLVLTIIGSAVWNTLLVSVGVLFGTAWESVVPYFNKYTYLAIALLGSAYLLYLICCEIKRRKVKTK